MIRKICFAAFAAIALLGCSEKDAELPHVEENAELVTFSVSVPGLDTKSTGGSADDEKTINRLQVFVFNRHGVYETSAVAAEGSVTITCTAGPKRMVALVNAKEEAGVADYESLAARPVYLKDSGVKNLVMLGDTAVTVAAGKPVDIEPALQGFDTKDCVLYLGTFSRSLSPSMRVSYLVLPNRLLNILEQEMSYYSNTVSRIEQYVLNKFIYDKHFERHINRTRKIYEQRRNVLIKALYDKIPDIKIYGEDSGLHFIAKLDDTKYDSIINKTKLDTKVDSVNMTKKYDNLYMTIIKKAFDKKLLIGGTESFLIFCYAHIDENQAKQIAEILCQVLQEI